MGTDGTFAAAGMQFLSCWGNKCSYVTVMCFGQKGSVARLVERDDIHTQVTFHC